MRKWIGYDWFMDPNNQSKLELFRAQKSTLALFRVQAIKHRIVSYSKDRLGIETNMGRFRVQAPPIERNWNCLVFTNQKMRFCHTQLSQSALCFARSKVGTCWHCFIKKPTFITEKGWNLCGAFHLTTNISHILPRNAMRTLDK